MQSPKDHLFVSLDKAFQDEIITESGVSLYKDTSLNPEWHVTCVGKVISVPHRIDTSRRELKGRTMEAKVGDEVIFSYMCVFDLELRERDTPVHKNLFYHEGQWLWKLDYMYVLGFIRDGEIEAAQDYVFLKAIAPKGEQLMSNGLWMPDMTSKQKPKGKAEVVSVGKPIEGNPTLSIQPGEIARYNDRYACKYEIKNKEYIVLHHNMILAKETN